MSLEQALRKLAAKLTNKNLSEVPNGEMERIIDFAAENAAGGGGEKGDTGPAGASVTAITLTLDSEGKITGGTATLSDSSTLPITVTTE